MASFQESQSTKSSNIKSCNQRKKKQCCTVVDSPNEPKCMFFTCFQPAQLHENAKTGKNAALDSAHTVWFDSFQRAKIRQNISLDILITLRF